MFYLTLWPPNCSLHKTNLYIKQGELYKMKKEENSTIIQTVLNQLYISLFFVRQEFYL